MDTCVCECMGRKLEYVIVGNKYIYKQRKKSLNDWICQLVKLLHKENYDHCDTSKLIHHLYNNKYWVSDKFYKKPCELVQMVNELGVEYILDL